MWYGQVAQPHDVVCDALQQGMSQDDVKYSSAGVGGSIFKIDSICGK